MTTPIIIAFGTILSDATVGLGYGFNLTQYVMWNFAYYSKNANFAALMSENMRDFAYYSKNANFASLMSEIMANFLCASFFTGIVRENRRGRLTRSQNLHPAPAPARDLSYRER